MPSTTPDHTSEMTTSLGSAAQNRNKIWLRGGLFGHFARMLGYSLLIPIYLVIQMISALVLGAFWLAHNFRTQPGWRRIFGGPDLALVTLLTT